MYVSRVTTLIKIVASACAGTILVNENTFICDHGSW